MDEAKTLVYNSVSALFTAMLLGAVFALISVGYMMWTYFSRQDAANARLSYYSNLTAYDNQTLSGADVLSLLSHADEYGLFVIFFDSNPGSETVFDNVNSVSWHDQKFVFYDPDGDAAYNLVDPPNFENSLPICDAAVDQVVTMLGSGSINNLSGATNLHGLSKAQLIELFTTNTTDGLGSLTSDGYAAFKMALVYANDGTTDVSGIVAVRANVGIEDFCVD